MSFPGAQWVKNLPSGDPGLNPGLGRSPGEGNSNSLQYSCLENPMDRGAWWAIVRGVTRVGHDLGPKPPPPCWQRTVKLRVSQSQTVVSEKQHHHHLKTCLKCKFSCSNQDLSSVQSFSRVWLFATPWIPARQDSLSITNSWSLLKLMSIESVMPSSHLILCRPLLLLPPIPPSIRVFSNESTLCMRWPKYWSFIFSISPSNEHPGLISFRMDCLDLLAVQDPLHQKFCVGISESSYPF